MSLQMSPSMRRPTCAHWMVLFVAPEFFTGAHMSLPSCGTTDMLPRPFGQISPHSGQPHSLLLTEAGCLWPGSVPILLHQPVLLDLVLLMQLVITTVNEAIEALHLAPALEVLHAAVAVAGDQTAKVSLVASADLDPLHRIVGVLRISDRCPHLVLLLPTRNGRIFTAAVRTHLLVVAELLPLLPAVLVGSVPSTIGPSGARQGILFEAREAFRIL
mmetsp:Transcript_129412/g.307054  ORF Transcript_129412/g.307054 Transcript_129412/m.307054 type:complete len:216 (+) Transcript_129412:159-806(+)